VCVCVAGEYVLRYRSNKKKKEPVCYPIHANNLLGLSNDEDGMCMLFLILEWILMRLHAIIPQKVLIPKEAKRVCLAALTSYNFFCQPLINSSMQSHATDILCTNNNQNQSEHIVSVL
jgi:hypothetical protein